MKTVKKKEPHPVLQNLRKIMNDKGLTQAALAEYADISPSQFSKILKGDLQISLWQLSNIATNLGMQLIDILTYPEKYHSVKEERDSVKATLTIELKENIKKEVLKSVFGKEELEILNKNN